MDRNHLPVASGGRLVSVSSGYVGGFSIPMLKRAINLAGDGAIASASLFSAYYMRYNLEIPPNFDVVLKYITAFFFISVVTFFLFGVHRGVWRFVSIVDLRNIVLASTASILAFLVAVFIVNRLVSVPRSVPLIAWFVMVALLSAPRAAYRVWTTTRGEQPNRTRLLIFGSTNEAEMIIRWFGPETNPENEVVGIVDYEATSSGRRLRGANVLGDVGQIDEIVERLTRESQTPDVFVIAEPRKHREAVRKITKVGIDLRIPVRRASGPRGLIGGQVAPRLDPLGLEDLLGRKPAHLELKQISRLIAGSTVLITGAGGSIGSEIARHVARFRPGRLVLLDQSEHALYQIDHEMREQSPEVSCSSVIASVRDRQTIFRLMAELKPHLVFHAAALKHVPLMESNVCEGVLTNVVGTKHVADAAIANRVRAMVMISTDKAIRPSSAMGASKRAAEAYCQALDVSGTATRFITVRFGNVLGSNGSVVPLFERQIAAGGPVTVTHPDMKRYFMTIREASELVLQAAAFGLEQQHRGGILVLDMGEPVKIIDLARTMIAMAGRGSDGEIPIAVTGVRPGEKLFEELFDPDEANEPASVEGLIVAKPRLIDLAVLNEQLDELESLAVSGEDLRTREMLGRIVIEYRSANDNGDEFAPAGMSALAGQPESQPSA